MMSNDELNTSTIPHIYTKLLQVKLQQWLSSFASHSSSLSDPAQKYGHNILSHEILIIIVINVRP